LISEAASNAAALVVVVCVAINCFLRIVDPLYCGFAFAWTNGPVS
jgi:hypothetical protein